MIFFLIVLFEVGVYELGLLFGCMEFFLMLILRKVYLFFFFLVCYLLLLLFIVLVYIRMIYKLWNDWDENCLVSGVLEDFKNSKRKWNVFKMMVVVVLCYVCCMMFIYVMFLWFDFGLIGK